MNRTRSVDQLSSLCTVQIVGVRTWSRIIARTLRLRRVRLQRGRLLRMFESQVPLRRIGEKCAPDTSISQKLCRPQDIAVKVTSLVPGAAASQKAAYVVKCTVARQFKRKRQISSQPVKWSSTLTLPPTFIQRERDSGFEFCLFGRVGQRGLARSFAGCLASLRAPLLRRGPPSSAMKSPLAPPPPPEP